MKKTMLIIAAVLCLCTQACAQEAQPAYLMTLDELPAWEDNYTRRTGYERKEDLIISSLPHESEWEFYFTPRRDTDILLDHDIPEEGEYRVVIGAQSSWIISMEYTDGVG